VVESAVKRGIKIMAHDISAAVKKFYTDAGTVMRKVAEDTERTDREASRGFDRLGGKPHEVGGGGSRGPGGGGGGGPKKDLTLQEPSRPGDVWHIQVNNTEEPAVGKVPYGSTRASDAAIQYREKVCAWGSGDVAVLDYTKDGSQYRVVTSSVPNQPKGSRGPFHAERRAWAFADSKGADSSKVRGIYSELQPCSVPHNCKGWITKTFPGAKVSWSFDYGKTVASRKAGVAALAQALARGSHV
jgi:hypothetical protein